MQPTSKQKNKKFGLELCDLLTGAAFPLMIQIIFSVSIILFADYNGEIGLQIAALVFGEVLIIGAYVVFGRQNGLTAYRRTVQQSKRREAGSDDLKSMLYVGEYAVYKGVLIGLISVIPFVIFEFIQCLAPNTVCEFVLKYAFGWAAYPFILIEQAPNVGELSEWLNFIWIIVLVGVHAAAYVWGGVGEKKRQLKIAEAQEIKDKKRR